MKKFIVACVIIFIIAFISYAQNERPKYEFKATDGTLSSEGILRDVTIEQVWKATKEVLIKTGLTINGLDKQSSTISAQKTQRTFKDLMQWPYNISLIFEEGDDGIHITAQVEITKSTVGYSEEKLAHKEAKKIFDKIAEALYGKEEKK